MDIERSEKMTEREYTRRKLRNLVIGAIALWLAFMAGAFWAMVQLS